MGMHFHGQPQSLEAEVRRALGRVDPNLTVVDLRSLEYQVAGNFSQEHLIALLTSLFGVLSLVLASVGLYGITSYQVNQRTKEIGLRMALGASRRGVLLLVLRGALMQVGLGLGVGIPVALLGGGLMADQLYVVKSYDPLSLGVAVVALLTAAILAGYIPARRAGRTEATRALRFE